VATVIEPLARQRGQGLVEQCRDQGERDGSVVRGQHREAQVEQRAGAGEPEPPNTTVSVVVLPFTTLPTASARCPASSVPAGAVALTKDA